MSSFYIIKYILRLTQYTKHLTTLNLFVEKNIVNVLVIEENETRYDAYLKLHGHFKCEKCGNIYDIEVESDTLDFAELEGYEIKEKHIYFKGVCRHCSEEALKN